MYCSTLKLMAAFAAVGLLSVNVAVAKNGGNSGNKGGNKGGNSGFKLSFGGNSGLGGLNSGIYRNNNNYNKNYNNNGNCNNNGNYNNGNNGNCNNGPIVNNLNLGRAYEPFHSSYVVQPGDSFYTISLKEYGTSANARFIAQFNNLPQNTGLALGQTLLLPSISSNGRLSLSRAPVAESLRGTTAGNPIANFGTPATGGFTTAANAVATTAAAAVEAPRPKVNVGSTLLVDGQTFGDKPGSARLRVSGLSLPIEVLDWTTGSVKIHLPTVELTSATKADIEVLRADGTLASKTGVELEAATEIAATK